MDAPVPRRALGQRPVHLRLPAQAVARAVRSPPAARSSSTSTRSSRRTSWPGSIRYHHEVTALRWSSDGAPVDRRGHPHATPASSCGSPPTFLWMCQGYYNHDEPYTPRVAGHGAVRGHRSCTRRRGPPTSTTPASGCWSSAPGRPRRRWSRRWREDGRARDDAAALAVVLVPRRRRSTSSPRTLEPLDLPPEWTHEILRRQYIQQLDWLAAVGQRGPRPSCTSSWSRRIRPLLPEGTDVEKHFTPRYRPWQQRIAFVPDGDFFDAMREGKASVVTDTITEFTREGRADLLGRGDRGRRRRHRHRLQPVACSATSRSPSTARRSTSRSGSPGAGS